MNVSLLLQYTEYLAKVSSFMYFYELFSFYFETCLFQNLQNEAFVLIVVWWRMENVLKKH